MLPFVLPVRFGLKFYCWDTQEDGGCGGQDKAVALEVIHKLVEGLEEDYLEGKTDREKEKIADTALFNLRSFLAGLRGEETLRIVLRESRDFLEEGEANEKHNHVVLPLRGSFKGEGVERDVI